jgi:hypothetical protein
MITRRTTSALLLASALLAPAQAWAASKKDAAAADALFRAGRKAMEASAFGEACPKFAESNRLDPAVGTLFNLANCEEKIGKLAEASTHFREVLELLPPKDDRAPSARAHLATMAPRLSRLTLVIPPGEPDTLAVSRDGVGLGAAAIGVATVVNAGDHEVTATAPGHADAHLHLTIAEGERREIAVHAGPAVGPVEGPVASASNDSAATRRTIGFVLGGVGIATLGVGAITGALTLGKASIVKDPAHCDAELRCDAVGVAAAKAGSTLSVVSTATIVGGAVAAAAGVVLVLTSRSSAPVTAGLVVSPIGATLQVGRSW